MTPKQQRFVDEYLVDLNATQAAIRAGYSTKTARQMASENLSKPDLQDAIASEQLARSEKTGIVAAWVLGEVKKVYEASMEARPVYDSKGNEKGFSFNPTAANKSLELLGRHLGMFKDPQASVNVHVNNVVEDSQSRAARYRTALAEEERKFQ